MITLDLSKTVYEKVCIVEAIKAFAGIANISMTETTEYCRCIFSGGRTSEQKTAMEFENYVIDFTNSTKP